MKKNLLGVIFISSLQAMQSQTLEVCIRLDTQEKAVSHDFLDVFTKEQCHVFGITGQSSACEKYIPVVSALCMDFFDRFECVQLKKDLVTNIPYMIQRDLVNASGQEQVVGVQKYSFPRYVPQLFVEKLKKGSIPHELYKNKEGRLMLNYRVEQLREKLHRIPHSNSTQELSKPGAVYRVPSFFAIPNLSKLGLLTFLLLLVVH